MDTLATGADVPEAIRTWLANLAHKYEITRSDSKASNGHLFFGTNRLLHTHVAIKFYYWDGNDEFHAEPRSLAEINSPNVLRVFDAGYVDNEFAYFVTPYCAGGDLDDLLNAKCFSVRQAIETCQGILQGLTFLHARRFVHRDIKPANIYLGEGGVPVIGDFGSIRRIPEGRAAVPASRHAILYRPPEAFTRRHYVSQGDVYQVGLVLFQLLGGHLPYEETAWLSKAQRLEYDTLNDPAEKTLFADECLTTRIVEGKLLDFSTLPSWVTSPLKRTIRIATSHEPAGRFPTVGDFCVKLADARALVSNWRYENGVPTVAHKNFYRVVGDGPLFRAQKRTQSGIWRNDNSFSSSTASELINEIDRRLGR